MYNIMRELSKIERARQAGASTGPAKTVILPASFMTRNRVFYSVRETNGRNLG